VEERGGRLRWKKGEEDWGGGKGSNNGVKERVRKGGGKSRKTGVEERE
jgi:hypothetical protein